MLNEKKLQNKMDELGFAERLTGTAAVKAAASLVAADRSIALTKELYPALAAASGAASWTRIERNMRHSIEVARSSSPESWGCFLGPAKCTNGEVIRRLARECCE